MAAPKRGVLIPLLMSKVVPSVRLSAGVGGILSFEDLVAVAANAWSSNQASWRASISAAWLMQYSAASGASI